MYDACMFDRDDAITGQSDRAASPASPDSEEQKKQTAPLWKIVRYSVQHSVVNCIDFFLLSLISERYIYDFFFYHVKTN